MIRVYLQFEMFYTNIMYIKIKHNGFVADLQLEAKRQKSLGGALYGHFYFVFWLSCADMAKNMSRLGNSFDIVYI